VEEVVKVRPILFSAPMVCAILAGEKTVTRRIVRLVVGSPGLPSSGTDLVASAIARGCRHGVPGDRLYVKETFATLTGGNGTRVVYRADGDEPRVDGWQDAEGKSKMTWTPSIFMRRQDSRITLEIDDVRVERLDEITEEDAKLEGFPIKGPVKARSTVTYPDGRVEKSLVDLYDFTARGSFAHLWDGIHGSGSWSNNPYVWRLAFRRVTP
jgi:hypothetical protein